MAQIRDAYDEVWSENLARRGNTWEQNIKTCVSVWVALRRLKSGQCWARYCDVAQGASNLLTASRLSERLLGRIGLL